MDERSLQGAVAEQAPVGSPAVLSPPARAGASSAGDALDDARALTILTTEHWSLLSARGLAYNESFSRAGMFLTFLSATLVALGIMAPATGFSHDFLLVAVALLGVDLFVGLATLGRVASATTEDIRYLQGMNRLRHAYHEIVPGLEPYFITSRHDDVRGIFAVYGTTGRPASLQGVLHGFTTVPGMVGVICSAVTAAIAGIVVLLLTGSVGLASVGASIVRALGVAASAAAMMRQVGRFVTSLESRFPSMPPAVPPPG
jgi:hypothetical protein